MSNRNKYKNIKKFSITILLSVGLILLIRWQVGDLSDLKDSMAYLVAQVRQGNKWLVASAVLLAPVVWLIESFKWRFLVTKFSNISIFKSFCSVLTGMSFAFISPGKVGDFAGRMLYFDSDIRLRIIIAVIVGNFAHIIVTFIMGTTGLILLLFYDAVWWLYALLFFAVLAIGVLLILYLKINEINIQIKNRRSWVNKVLVSIKVLKRYSKRDLLIVCVFSLFKFIVYTIQFLVIAYIFGARLDWFAAFFIASTMFWMITIIPSIFITDIAVRAFVAELLFISTGFAPSLVSILGGSYALWVINWIMPSLIGTAAIVLYRTFRQESE